MVTPDALFLAALLAMRGPIVWGRSDCCCAATAAWAHVYGFDPMQGARGTYCDEAGAMRFMLRRGGFVPCVAGILEPQGFVLAAPAPGSIGIVAQPQSRFSGALGLCIAPGQWAVKTDEGMAITDAAERSWQWRV